jgi:putative YpdA family bacillithiol system oxidoreductase
VVDAFDLQIAFDERVEAIEREAVDGDADVFALETSSRGVKRVRHARHIVLATGYFDHPNCIGVPGEDLPHVRHYYREPHEHYRQRVVVVGGGNSAAEAALELYRAGARVTLVHRGPHLKPTIKYWVRPDIENRIKEGSIAARFRACVTEIRPNAVVIAPNREHDPAAERRRSSARPPLTAMPPRGRRRSRLRQPPLPMQQSEPRARTFLPTRCIS